MSRIKIQVGDQIFSSDFLVAQLSPFISQDRKEKIEQVLQWRTMNIPIVLDGIYDRGNISAVFRSADALGYQSIHVVENQPDFRVSNRSSQGAEKWLTIKRWREANACLKSLKSQGFKVCVSRFGSSNHLSSLNWNEQKALVLGNEKDGVSAAALNSADEDFQLPMYGFAQSFNISVAAALCFDQIRRLREPHGDLSKVEKERLRAQFYLRSCHFSQKLLQALSCRSPRKADKRENLEGVELRKALPVLSGVQMKIAHSDPERESRKRKES